MRCVRCDFVCGLWHLRCVGLVVGVFRATFNAKVPAERMCRVRLDVKCSLRFRVVWLKVFGMRHLNSPHMEPIIYILLLHAAEIGNLSCSQNNIFL